MEGLVMEGVEMVLVWCRAYFVGDMTGVSADGGADGGGTLGI